MVDERLGPELCHVLHFQIDLIRECPFWESNGFCVLRDCAVTTVDEVSPHSSIHHCVLSVDFDIMCSKMYLPNGEQSVSVVSTAPHKTSYESHSQVAITATLTFVFSTTKSPKVSPSSFNFENYFLTLPIRHCQAVNT